ncbi:hypothetical protein M0802_012584 [Mischocyttarus mexicanus]|nr:hypothetical protein M0802_012584 [Mischocyttarus mexicanus]
MNCTTEIMSGKIKCQYEEEREHVKIEAEQDELLRSNGITNASRKIKRKKSEIQRAFLFANDFNANFCNNAIFGIGELALHGKEAVYPHYTDILQVLSSAISRGSALAFDGERQIQEDVFTNVKKKKERRIKFEITVLDVTAQTQKCLDAS